MKLEAETVEELLERVQRKLRTKGLEIAIDALIAVCEDKTAPGAARAQAASSLVRANGLFAIKPDVGKKSPAEMTPEELDAELRQLRRDLTRRQSHVDEDDDDPGEESGGGNLFD